MTKSESMDPNYTQKREVGKILVGEIRSGMILGIGTGSTVDAALEELKVRLQSEKLDLRAVVTSIESARSCAALGIPVLSTHIDIQPDLGFDGADEVDATRTVIKGKGAALLREKFVAASCKRFIILVDQTKVVTALGQKMPVPVEVFPEAIGVARRALETLGASEITIRQCSGGKHGPVITEKGNILLDCRFPKVDANLERTIKQQVGVVDSGIFSGIVHEVFVAGGKRF